MCISVKHKLSMTNTKSKINTIISRKRRHKRLRSRVAGTVSRPRLSVYRSNTAIYVQLIDDDSGVTLASFDSRRENKGTLQDKAKVVGEKIAEKAKKNGIEFVVFDRGGFKYQGAIAALAESARSAGLKF